MRRLNPRYEDLGLGMSFAGYMDKYTAFWKSVKTVNPGRMVAGRS
jgi:glycine cleavage system pyridoxal-binding protein P